MIFRENVQCCATFFACDYFIYSLSGCVDQSIDFEVYMCPAYCLDLDKQKIRETIEPHWRVFDPHNQCLITRPEHECS
jgi:hypothetical protein